jgi:AcrR family transcriptional regulator
MARPRQHSRESILAAVSIAFRDAGVSATTAQIAKAANVSNGTLFNYYPTKQSLIDALYVWLKKDLAEAIDSIEPTLPPRSQMHLIWDRWLAWAQNHPDRHAVIRLLHGAGLASDAAHTDANQYFAVPARALADAQAAGVFVDLPTMYLVEIMEQQIDLAAASGLDSRAEQIAFDVMWNGITNSSINGRE